MAGKKTSVWLTEEDAARFDLVYQEMVKRELFPKGFKLKRSEALRLLLRWALTDAELDYLRKIPDNIDPDEVKEALEKEYRSRLAILDELDDEGWMKDPRLAAQVRPYLLSDEDWDKLIEDDPTMAKYKARYEDDPKWARYKAERKP